MNPIERELGALERQRNKAEKAASAAAKKIAGSEAALKTATTNSAQLDHQMSPLRQLVHDMADSRSRMASVRASVGALLRQWRALQPRVELWTNELSPGRRKALQAATDTVRDHQGRIEVLEQQVKAAEAAKAMAQAQAAEAERTVRVASETLRQVPTEVQALQQQIGKLLIDGCAAGNTGRLGEAHLLLLRVRSQTTELSQRASKRKEMQLIDSINTAWESRSKAQQVIIESEDELRALRKMIVSAERALEESTQRAEVASTRVHELKLTADGLARLKLQRVTPNLRLPRSAALKPAKKAKTPAKSGGTTRGKGRAK